MRNSSEINRILLDTNAFLYFINNDSALTETAKNTIESEVDLLIEKFIPAQLQQNDIEILSVNLKHLDRVSALPFHHKDQFDPIIIAQSAVEDLPMVSSDAAFDLYKIERIW